MGVAIIFFLFRDWSSNLSVFKGHTDGITGFSVWGQDVISIARNKIGLSSLSKTADEVSVIVCLWLHVISLL